MTADERVGQGAPRLSRRALLHRLLGAGGLAIAGAPALAATPFTSRRIVVSAKGSGPDVVLIPGLGSGPAIWSELIAALPGYRWHRVQVRGFAGLPPQDNASGDLLVPLADEIARYMREAGLAAPALIGHSMGGTLAMLVALRSPARVGRLMVVDMLPAAAGLLGGTAEGMGFLARQLRGYFTRTEAGRRAFARLLQDAPGAAGSDPDVIATALDELAELDLSSRLSTLRLPLTVVPALPADARTAADFLGQFRAAYRPAVARIVPVRPSGHMVMQDQPGAFAQVVRGFLR